MSSSGPNKLRPYYDHDTFDAGYSVIYKPSVGLIDTQTSRPISSLLKSSVSSKKLSDGSGNFSPGKGIGLSGFSSIKDSAANKSIGASDKNYVYDLEFQEYFDFNNLSELFKNLVWNFCKNYFKVVLSQPLEIVRLVLQVGYFNFEAKNDSKKSNSKSKHYSRLLDTSTSTLSPQVTDVSDSESEAEINYFQSTNDVANASNSYIPNSTLGNKKASSKKSRTLKNLNKIQPISKHTIDIMTAVASKDGPLALFRGVNAQFIHQTLSHTIEAWITGFISPFLGIPDPFFLDLTHSTDPFKSFWLSVLACVLTGVILMPLDLIKIRLMITQFNKPLLTDSPDSISSPESLDSPNLLTQDLANTTNIDQPSPRTNRINTRSIRDSIRNYPIQLLLRPPPTIALLTILHQFSTSVFRKTAPYLMYIRFNIDSYHSSNLFTLINLILLIMEFFIKLPVENLLRKEQINFLLRPKSLEEDEKRVVTIDNPDEDLIVEYNSWNLHETLYEDNLDDNDDINDAERKSISLIKAGGITGFLEKVKRLNLFNGWRVGVLNIIGFWGYNILKSNNSSIAREEKL